MKLTRKDFLVGTLAGAAALIDGCGGGDEAPAGVTSCGADITDNPPSPGLHKLVVPAADVKAGAAKTYHIQGAADHDHTAVLTATDMKRLKNGELAAVTSSITNGHQHDISIQCH